MENRVLGRPAGVLQNMIAGDNILGDEVLLVKILTFDADFGSLPDRDFHLPQQFLNCPQSLKAANSLVFHVLSPPAGSYCSWIS
ncbi:MAG: hypothetical protein UX02_C0001G0351 [Candidatus Moranbacteria bacterium GW2011_GWC1_45_18]|nr:MAG: hypothetical protein UT79_C0002G0046 [Candidatus Moranbacteria bacterium GW2011_GWC2_40_12]KKT33805.1 MAG: hypothetical protein UW19_C0005G0051 [Candidatus Moranbacteria bacterium GW2011_GWF2_44_10]KKU00903.1 MAG: hypothetical protein UX02_C0001G0351 [Candidatus Moranbacteria bacterium GW2011_GWC1_45_18]OGI34720.1 MAG: hypothetical protein A2407_03075 [Candidatus Moranbacteria bacterium RIFOXYC1_FULL_44_8]OGI40337.1 MAG: hypothetical protein A2374_04195 [Candidatus Moranbacteria bacteri